MTDFRACNDAMRYATITIGGGTSVSPRWRDPLTRCPRPQNILGCEISKEAYLFHPSKEIPIVSRLSEQSASMWVESCQYDEDSDNSNNRTSARGDHQQSPSEDSHGNSRARLVIQPSLDTTINDVDRCLWETVLTSEYWSRNNSWLRADMNQDWVSTGVDTLVSTFTKRTC